VVFEEKGQPRDIPPEGFMNAKTGEHAHASGGYIDVDTAIYIPPPPGSTFDPNTGVYIPPKEYGDFDHHTGEYIAPEGFTLDHEGEFHKEDGKHFRPENRPDEMLPHEMMPEGFMPVDAMDPHIFGPESNFDFDFGSLTPEMMNELLETNPELANKIKEMVQDYKEHHEVYDPNHNPEHDPNQENPDDEYYDPDGTGAEYEEFQEDIFDDPSDIFDEDNPEPTQVYDPNKRYQVKLYIMEI
jgi:hypothetical protein